MKKHSLPFLLVAVLMLAGALLTGCQGSSNTPAPATSAPAPAATATPAPAESSAAAVEPTAAPALEPYTFTHYFNYDWWGMKDWGKDEVSKYYQEKFKITVDFQKPDSDAAAKLNIMISSDELPDSIMMDRGPDNVNLAKLGKLVPLEPFMAKDKTFEENVLPNTIKQLQIEGKLYGIPNWSRKAASGGNNAWIYDKRIYEAVGSPKMDTFEDMYAYAKAAKALGKNKEGLEIVPMTGDQTADGYELARGFYRSFGGYNQSWYTVVGGKYQLALRDPTYKKAIMAINQWWRDGLINPSQFSDTGDQITEKITTGRVALMWYDHSKNETTHYRDLVRKIDGDSMEITPFPFPPAEGLDKAKIYADNQPTIGWNVTCITTKAAQPERIYQLWTSFLSKEGSIIMMYGPKGFNWDTLDANGNPILKKAEAEQTPEEKDKLGAWFWAIPGQSDNVDKTKFAVNDMQPAEKQNWVVSSQAHIFTPLMTCSDEFNNIDITIDSQDDNGIARKLCEDYLIANLPKAMMAKTADEASKIYDEIVKFADDNGLTKVEEIYNTKYQDNVKNFGGTLLTK